MTVANVAALVNGQIVVNVNALFTAYMEMDARGNVVTVNYVEWLTVETIAN